MSCVFVQDVCKAASEVKIWPLDLGAERLARFWRASTIYAAGTRVRPSRPTGYEFEATATGQTNIVEPAWSMRGDTVDGSIVWIRRPISSSSLLRTITAVTWTAPAGITATNAGNITSDGQQIIRVQVSGGTDGQTYLVTGLVTYDDGQQELFGVNVSVENP